MLENKYVEHDGHFYRQINGAAMVLAISVALSYIYLWKKVAGRRRVAMLAFLRLCCVWAWAMGVWGWFGDA